MSPPTIMNEVDQDAAAQALGILICVVLAVLGSAVLLGLATRLFVWASGIG